MRLNAAPEASLSTTVSIFGKLCARAACRDGSVRPSTLIPRVPRAMFNACCSPLPSADDVEPVGNSTLAPGWMAWLSVAFLMAKCAMVSSSTLITSPAEMMETSSLRHGVGRAIRAAEQAQQSRAHG
eukprot:scaffold878_cov271-Pinguiococcus_pyrenoidosus.AAC.53